MPPAPTPAPTEILDEVIRLLQGPGPLRLEILRILTERTPIASGRLGYVRHLQHILSVAERGVDDIPGTMHFSWRGSLLALVVVGLQGLRAGDEARAAAR